jgi:tetratricopeptide (TPR) repeat protein
MELAKIVKKGLEEYSKNKFDEALKLFKKALPKATNNKDKAIILRNIGLCHYSVNNYKASEINFKNAVELGYQYAEWELCLAQLQSGNIEGMTLYSSRYYSDRNTFPNLPIKKINTVEQIRLAKKILVLNEQGFGDEILFSRGLKLLEGKEFSYQVYPEMLELFKRSFSGNFFDERHLSSSFVFDHDYWIPSGDLFKLVTISGDYKHLEIKSSKGNRNKIGVCLFSNPKSMIGQKKSISLDRLKDIIKPFHFDWVSLQYGVILDFAENPKLDNFWDTKKVIDDLGLVVTVDTAVANLAASMNKQVILLVNEWLDWRWALNLWQGDIQICKLDELEQALLVYRAR